MASQLAYILVGDHLGQVKKVLPETGEIVPIACCADVSSSNPVVSIEPIVGQNKQLIANKQGHITIYDCIRDESKALLKAEDSLIRAIPVSNSKLIYIYDKRITLDEGGDTIKQKKGEITNAKLCDTNLATVGVKIPLRVIDLVSKRTLFEADPPDKDWLGIQPEVYVSNLDFVGPNRVVTCSKSDSVIRVYDLKSPKRKPVISIDIDQTAFNEHADSARFVSVASTGELDHSVVAGSNVGQILAIDLRLNAKQLHPKKKLQPRTYKVLGGFKGARGGSIKDVKIIPTGESGNHQVISCCLDRYLRIHNFTKTSRDLYKHVYMKTKPLCCSPVFFKDP